MKSFKKLSLSQTFALTGAILLSSACNRSGEYFEKTILIAPIEVEKTGKVFEPEKEPTKLTIVDEICKGGAAACDLTPKVTKPGVVTMLLAFGDLVNDKVVITEGSARVLAQNSVKYASPVEQPKILVVKDHNNNGESAYDTEYIAKVLLANYNKVDVLNEASTGLTEAELEGYDLIWFNNPGYPMGSAQTMKRLMEFKGGVILSGDDLAQGNGFSLEPLTGLKFLNNGTSMNCDGKSFNYDNNNSSNRYQVEISAGFLPGLSEDLRLFEYGNDIDDSALGETSRKLEVLASAKGAPGTCGGTRPVITRYAKQ